MRYVISDIHGCYEEYMELIDKISLSTEKDTIYILGDTLDKGPEPIKVLLDIIQRKNVSHILGNHEYLFLYFIRKMGLNLSEINNMSEEDIQDFYTYLEDGGAITIKKYLQLSLKKRQQIVTYIKNSKKYYDLKSEEKRYVMVHAGISHFNERKLLKEYHTIDFIEDRANYKKRYFKDKNTYLITGHTPTSLIFSDRSTMVYNGNGHIAIDCGCVYGGKLAAYCIETGQTTYVNAKNCYIKCL